MSATNLLFVFSDEHEARTAGFAGHPLARTPNLDRLAARGICFTHAWTPSPICVPARASLATGRFAHDIGYWDNAHGYDGRVRGWAHALRDAGHRVEAIGKLHYRNAGDDTGFSAQHNVMHLADGIGQVWGSVRDPMPASAGPSPLFNELGAGESRYNRFDLASTERAIEWLHARAARPDPQPWALFLGYVAPHFPLVVPQRFLDLYPPDTLPLPKLLPREGFARHPWVEAQANHGGHDDALASDERRRLALASYLGLVSFLDEQVGRLNDALAATGLAASTLVVYSSDHGDNLGKRAMWNKCLLYRESTGVPMILAGPGVNANTRCATHVNLVDLGATFVEALGGPHTPEAIGAGTSLLALARAPYDPTRLAFSEYHAVGSPTGAFMLADDRYKLHYYVGYPPELFDLRNDPEEAHDLAGDPAHAPILRRMEALLRARLDPEAIDRRAKADQAALVARVGGRERALALGPRGATPVPG